MIVYVVISDVGLNGPLVHAVLTSPPDESVLDNIRTRCASLTGYQNTEVIEVEVDRWARGARFDTWSEVPPRFEYVNDRWLDLGDV